MDGDDEGDACDTDVDGDGLDNPYDYCPGVYSLERGVDRNGDGVGTECDPTSCPSRAPVAAGRAGARTANGRAWRWGLERRVRMAAYAFVRFDKRVRRKLFRMPRLRSQVKAVAVDRGGNTRRLGRHLTLLR